MGKSSASCFKIIACGGDSVDHEDVQMPETKASNDRRGWSFRKTSVRHRVLSNTVMSEAPLSANKESPESTATGSQQPNLNVPEKTSVNQWTEEKTDFSAQMDSKLSELIADTQDDCKSDPPCDVSSIILIQAAISGYLARRVLLKQKNAIKLQAAVRGHLVRKHAIGTLRCVQAIVKLQALVRARQSEKQNKNSEIDNLGPNLLRRNTEAKPNGTFTNTYIEKLLSNKFARQLMESTPRKKPINIKCNPSKSDSAWTWLERWMSVSSASNIGPQEPALGQSGETSENEDSLITYEADNLDLHTSSSNRKKQNIDESNLRYDVTESGPTMMKETDFISKVERKMFLTEQPETEAIKFSSSTNQPFRSREIGMDETSSSNPSAIQIALSECGTELSISSTLDSPDRSEAGVNDLKHEPQISSAADNPSTENSKLEANESSYAETNRERHGTSPRSHVSVPESQATPSSQLFVKPKKSRGEKSDSSHKCRSLSADKRFITTPNYDSEYKAGKRRNSFVAAKTDHADQEPRDSSSGISLPSYMQATESARAKAILNGSPKSSPDVQDKDIYIKNRHSLPVINERQGSPRIQRPQPQAQPKGIGVKSPQERKWRR